jgi:sigma-B regulation protein RsbU (phosphoserine phosphatase)
MQSPQYSISYLHYLVEEIMRVTAQTLKASASSVLLIDRDKQELSFQFVCGPAEGVLEEASLGTETGVAGWVARHGTPLMVNNVADDHRFCHDIDEITGFVTESILCAPLVTHGKVIGVIEVLNKLDGSDFNDMDLQTLVAVASTAAIAIEVELAKEALRASEARFSELVGNLSERDFRLFDPDTSLEAGAGIRGRRVHR